ncbi:hypothetical protein GQR58_009188 [Nymphon striatum]|nr:hypothetical protein GQR58_009188 [Nymphon striatum]
MPTEAIKTCEVRINWFTKIFDIAWEESRARRTSRSHNKPLSCSQCPHCKPQAFIHWKSTTDESFFNTWSQTATGQDADKWSQISAAFTSNLVSHLRHIASNF